MDKRISLGINASIILILIIFCALLSLPLRYLFNTNYKGIESTETYSQKSKLPLEEKVERRDVLIEVKDFKKMKVCPVSYEIWLKSLFITNYDKNCTREKTFEDNLKVSLEEEKEEEEEEEEKEEEEEAEKKVIFIDTDQSANEIISTVSATTSKETEVKDAQRNKSIPVAVHILAIMLVGSVIVALVEVVRIRFADKDLSTTGTSRRGSIINFVAQKKEMLKSQRSLDLQAMHKSTRLLGKASLFRRSSFPIQDITKIESTVNRLSKFPSVDSEDVICETTNLHHRPHLIRRH